MKASNLPAWGYQDCQYDPQDGSYGGPPAKLLFRMLPGHYDEQYLKAAASVPLNDVHRSSILSNLYLSRFELFGDIRDLESAIEQLREAVVSILLNSPAGSSHTHFPFLDPVYVKDHLEKANTKLAGKYCWERRSEQLGDVIDMRWNVRLQPQCPTILVGPTTDLILFLHALEALHFLSAYGSRFFEVSSWRMVHIFISFPGYSYLCI